MSEVENAVAEINAMPVKEFWERVIALGNVVDTIPEEEDPEDYMPGMNCHMIEVGENLPEYASVFEFRADFLDDVNDASALANIMIKQISLDVAFAAQFGDISLSDIPENKFLRTQNGWGSEEKRLLRASKPVVEIEATEERTIVTTKYGVKFDYAA